ncbi:MAG TPA: winged helix-turn-helix transcriptional regulator, partial [Candidatus Thermoplasmatota archaeon]|nr:winged helix-turn-helix transcriptional regulator [Candidatus Thermoplasmatota archaeon]
LTVVGDTTFVLQAQRLVPHHVPILGVAGAGYGILTEVTVAQFEGALKRLAAGDYWVEELDRLTCRIRGQSRAIALNEAALVAATSGKFVRYSLLVDGELLWRDRGDGVIIATPTGSTAYALSAGGPIVLANAGVFSVVPICSWDQNKPLIVKNNATLTLADVSCAGGVDLLVDGGERIHLSGGEEVQLVRSDSPARFVRFGGRRYGQLLGKLKAEKELSPELADAPPSAKFIFKLLQYEGGLTQQEIVRESNLSVRTVRNALNYLTQEGVLAKEPSLRDARQEVYNLRERVGKR